MSANDWAGFAIDFAVGLAVSAVAGFALVKLLPRWQFKQIAYEDAPATHQVKTGTPTMGGLAFLAAIAVGCAMAMSPMAAGLAVLVFGCAAVGLVDDLLSIVNGKNRGLRARTKLLATALVAIVFLRMIAAFDHPIDDFRFVYPPDVVFHAGAYVLMAPHWLWLLLGILAVVGTIHAVNLTDGLDGLASGTVLPPLFVFWLVAASMGRTGDGWASILPVAIGGIFGFLIYNHYPAKMFMGDTGSLALGALLSGAAILTGEMLLLVLVGGVFVAETLSVMLQVAYFKLTGGKRIFRMSPLHHHFEMVGWPETKVTVRFWIASLLCSIAGWAIVR